MQAIGVKAELGRDGPELAQRTQRSGIGNGRTDAYVCVSRGDVKQIDDRQDRKTICQLKCLWGWSGGSMLKRTYNSCRGFKLGSQHLHCGS